MGQYYKPVSIDRKEFVNPSDYGHGSKLMEHSWLANPMVNSILHSLTPGNAWYKTRIVWAGDYMNEGLFISDLNLDVGSDKEEDDLSRLTLYETAVSFMITVRPTIPDGPQPMYIVNHDSMEFVDLRKCPPDDDGWIIHPLPLLTCSGNGRGGGDYRGNNPYVGTWAGKTISAEYWQPGPDYKEIIPDFMNRNRV